MENVWYNQKCTFHFSRRVTGNKVYYMLCFSRHHYFDSIPDNCEQIWILAKDEKHIDLYTEEPAAMDLIYPDYKKMVIQNLSVHIDYPLKCAEEMLIAEMIMSQGRTAVVMVPLKSRRRILESSEIWNDATRAWIGRIRNGVETVPSVIRNKYLVDQMPVIGKLRTKQFFGFKVAALNITKLIRYTKGKLKCRTFELA